jgi:hypothetical protein
MEVFVPKMSAGREAAVKRLAVTLMACDPDSGYDLKITPRRRRRSDQQNKYLWGVVYAEILKHLDGWDAEDVHEYFLGEHFGWETLEGMGRKRLRPVRRSSRLNKQEFADYIAFIQRKMAERGVFIQDPE